MRPKELASDDTPDLPVFQHALKWLKDKENYAPDIVVQLRPTSPLRPLDCIDRAVVLLRKHPKAGSVRGVVPSGQNPYKMWYLTPQAGMKPLLGEIPEAYNMPRQALPKTFWQTGHVDAIQASTIMAGSMSGRVIWPLLIDPAYTVDLDTPRDWALAEWIIKHAGLDMVRPSQIKRPLPKKVQLLVLDFDGVLTDNRVWVDGQGRESVAVDRGDGLGIARLKETGVEILVLSTETNPGRSSVCWQ